MIWIIGQYADRIDNANELLSIFLDSFLEEATEVQLSLLTAIVKLFLHQPTGSEELIRKSNFFFLFQVQDKIPKLQYCLLTLPSRFSWI